MSEQLTKQEETKQPEQQKQEISIDTGTAFNLKLQEFDKKIAEAELAVATLKKEKASFIYDQNVQQIVMVHKERVIKAQIEEETKKKLATPA
ncbi:MAG: hypothetical protein PHF86_04135 [Candidatus Nanoarchaeia archaeon]|jgi:hypothetical protein|nr:hypothetical protein [Candidatus Nanoarchaeia archaeon]